MSDMTIPFKPTPSTTVPHRRLRLGIDLEADDLGTLSAALEGIASMLESNGGEDQEITSGAYYYGYAAWLRCNPEQTGGTYRRQLEDWRQAKVETVRAEDVAAARVAGSIRSDQILEPDIELEDGDDRG